MISLFFIPCVQALENNVLIHEDFNDLVNWNQLYFPKIKKHTVYSIVRNGDGSYLQAESNASASGIVFNKEINVFEYSKMRWRWQINNVFKKGDAKQKSGDDYPLRVYILFNYDPDKASFGKKLKYGIAKKIYGEYPPHSSISYIWANKNHEERMLINTYADEARMIVLQAGEANAGRWIEQEVDIIDDYHEAFGEDPPPTARLAIMNDSDDTGESAVSLIDYIEIYR